MSRWFRFYADAMRNPKVAALSDHDFRLWVELLALASENGGHIPPLESLKHVLKRRLDHLSRGLNGLIRALLIDALSDGYEPHNWSKFQYKSDTSTDRVHKFREKRNVSETPPEQIQSRTDIPAAKATGICADDFPRLDCASAEVWRDFLKNRKAKRLPCTATAHKRLCSDLEAMTARTGWPPGQVFEACVAKGWGAIYDPREKTDDRQKQSSRQPLIDIARTVAADMEREAQARVGY